jgi:type VI secretion system protein ImpK
MQPAMLPDEADAALRRFRAFYEELFAIKQALHEGDWLAAMGERAMMGGAAEDQVARAVQMRLRRAIAAQGFGGPIPAGALAGIDPGYVMATVADEALLHGVSWPGRAFWIDTPLEQVLYRSRIGGDRVFQAVEDLTSRQRPDPDGTAMTILLALELGFRGRYRATKADAQREREYDAAIARAKHLLFELIFHSHYLEDDKPVDLVVGATESLGRRQPQHLPQLRPWLLALSAVIAGYLAVSWLIWIGQVAGIIENAHHITAALQ